MPTMMKPRLKMAMAAAEMLYSAAHERRDAGASGGARRPLTYCSCPQVSDCSAFCRPCFPGENTEGQRRNHSFRVAHE